MRGASLSSGRDPDAASRKVRGAGQKPTEAGSEQDWATGRPTSGSPINDMTLNYPHLPYVPQRTFWIGLTTKVASWNDDPFTYPLYGGDNETRPINASIHFYIKYRLAGGLAG